MVNSGLPAVAQVPSVSVKPENLTIGYSEQHTLALCLV